jgi:glycosyltransferase involved in cell wall biosynthesis
MIQKISSKNAQVMYPPFKLSIVIPTRNRYEYLIHCLVSILNNYNNEYVEIIVHDNSTDIMPNNVSAFLLSNKSIKYTKVDTWISGVENFERAIALAQGDFITMLGDDDAVGPDLLKAIAWMSQNECDALYSPFVSFLWPDIESRLYGKEFSGVLSIKSFDGKWEPVDNQKEIQECLNSGGTSLKRLPRMYYGIIKKTVMEKVKATTGVYIPGPSPDMANAVSAGLFSQKAYFVNYPLFIAGNSIKSTAGMGAQGKHVGKLENIVFLPKECALEWSRYIPRFWSGPTIWAEAAHKAIEKSNRKDLLKEFNYLKVIAHSCVYNREWLPEIMVCLNRYMQEQNKGSFFTWLILMNYYIQEWMLRLQMFILNITKLISKNNNHYEVFSDIDNVQIAASKFEEYLMRNKITLFKE